MDQKKIEQKLQFDKQVVPVYIVTQCSKDKKYQHDKFEW